MEKEILEIIVIGLLFIIIALIVLMLYVRIYGMARIYNWNGQRYCYLGTAALCKEGKAYAVRINEHMVDLSHTTLYRICPSRVFCVKNRYKDMFVYADKSRRHLVVDAALMKAEIPF